MVGSGSAESVRRRRWTQEPRVAYPRTLGGRRAPWAAGATLGTGPLLKPLRGRRPSTVLALAPRVRGYATLGCGVQRLRRKDPTAPPAATVRIFFRPQRRVTRLRCAYSFKEHATHGNPTAQRHPSLPTQ